MRPVGFSGGTRSLEWIRAPDCSPATRTFFLAPPDRGMDALWPGNRRLIHPISSHAGTGGLPARSTLFYVLGQFRSVCLLSFPLAAVYPVSFCPVSISGIFVHSGRSMHRRSSSHDTPLERAPDTHQLEYGCRPGVRSYNRSHRMERTLLWNQALRYRRGAKE